MADKERLDLLIVNKGLVQSRERAKALIMAGEVYVNGVKEDKAGTKVDVKGVITLKGSAIKYVSRGGFKLEKATDQFGISLKGKR